MIQKSEKFSSNQIRIISRWRKQKTLKVKEDRSKSKSKKKSKEIELKNRLMDSNKFKLIMVSNRLIKKRTSS